MNFAKRHLRGIATIALVMPVSAYAQDGDWQGLYGGIEAGVASSKADIDPSDPVYQLSNVGVLGRGIVVVPGLTINSAPDLQDKSAFAYGILFGGQLQRGRTVFGIEGDLHGPRDLLGYSISRPTPITILAPAGTVVLSRSARMNYDWSLRARVGLALGSRALVYATGGLAGSRVRMTGSDTFTTPAGAAATSGGTAAFVAPAIGPVIIASTETRSMTGWTAGGGIEYKISPRLGIGFDARYTDYGSRDFTLASGCTPAACVTGTVSAPPVTIIQTSTGTTGTPMLPGAVPGATSLRFRSINLAVRAVYHF
jgi:outer membrane immunogenic protein